MQCQFKEMNDDRITFYALSLQSTISSLTRMSFGHAVIVCIGSYWARNIQLILHNLHITRAYATYKSETMHVFKFVPDLHTSVFTTFLCYIYPITFYSDT
jgi:hypothetical protein